MVARLIRFRLNNPQWRQKQDYFRSYLKERRQNKVHVVLESLFFKIDLSNFQFTLKRGINIYIMNPRNCFEFNST